MVLADSTISLYIFYASVLLKKLSNTGVAPVPPAHAANWGSLTPSVCGSKIGAKEARCLDGACESTISFYMVYGSAILKNYPPQVGRLCLRLMPELAGQNGSKG